MNTDMESMISSYIEDELNKEDKTIFENYMNDNPKFSQKVHIMRNMINQFNNQEMLTPSDHFIDNLHYEISNLSQNDKITTNNRVLTYWFSTNWKATLGFSFMIAFIGMFFLNRILISTNEINISNSDNLEENTTLLSDSDSLKTNNTEFPIHQVKGTSTDK